MPTDQTFYTKAIASLVLLFCLVNTSPVLAQNHSLKVTIDNVRDEQGAVLVALYQTSNDFMKNRFMSLKLPAIKGKVTGLFENVPPGEYAISVLHDTDNDMELNKNGIGIPREGVGFSNDAIGRFGPPDFKKAAFEFPKNKEVIIILKYW